MAWLKRLDPREALAHPAAYHTHSRMAASDRRKRDFVERFLKPQPLQRVLDIGCGTAALLPHMPDVAYVGFDLSVEYIQSARKLHGSRGEFHHRALTPEVVRDFEPFDLAMAIGVVHHLDDKEADLLFKVAWEALKPGGRLITCDGAFITGQNPVARLLLKLDRGEFIRGPDGYEAIARQTFANVDMSVHHDLNSFPYTHCLMVCHRT